MNGNGKELKQVVLDGEALETYRRLKTTLLLENDSDVLRYCIVFTEKKIK